MSRQHSATPWTIREQPGEVLVIVDALGNDTTVMADLQDDPAVGINGDPEGAHTDMRRIVACVNACAEIRTDLLEKGRGVFDIVIGVAQQRDELLAALKLCKEAGLHKHILNTGETLAQVVAAAIAKTEAGQ